MPRTPKGPQGASAAPVRHAAIVGGGMAGVTAARTLMQAGWRVTLIEKSRGWGGRMSTRQTPFGSFDHGAQYFTVRDRRFELALATAPETVRPWSANTVRVLDPLGHAMASAPPPPQPHWVGVPGMNALVREWARPLVEGQQRASARLSARVLRIERDALHPDRWQLQLESTADDSGAQEVIGGFDEVVLAVPHPQAQDLLRASGLLPEVMRRLEAVSVAPCWTLMVAFPQAMQPGLSHLGPHWNAARSTHHRLSWVARESSKPGRQPIERWTAQASPAWSTEHLEDDAERVKAKLLKAFAEITGIRAEPAHAQVHRWRYAQTLRPLGQSYWRDAQARLSLCGDWCLGHRVEAAFVSGLELALAMVDGG